jgi:homoserine O-acetyltransferase
MSTILVDSQNQWIITPQQAYFEQGCLELESGKLFGPITIQYETYGTLNPDRSNAILIIHAFSGDAHAAGYHTTIGNNPGWWHDMIGPGKAFDTNKFFIISSNCLGGCMGTTGPSSINPETGKAYGMDFPVITIKDLVNTQLMLIDYLGIKKLFAIAGGSMGGMQVLDWAASHPDRLERAIILASTTKMSAQGLAFNAVGRNAIISDPNWMAGDYYGKEVPRNGLAIARMIGHITYLSTESMTSKFGRKLQERENFNFDFNDLFQVESYLSHQGDKFVNRFDANSYLYLSKAMDYFDLSAYPGGIYGSLSKTDASFLVLSYSSDWLFPTSQSKELVYALMKLGKNVSFSELSSPYGHDSFLLETDRQTNIINSFLSAPRNNLTNWSILHDGK